MHASLLAFLVFLVMSLVTAKTPALSFFSPGCFSPSFLVPGASDFPAWQTKAEKRVVEKPKKKKKKRTLKDEYESDISIDNYDDSGGLGGFGISSGQMRGETSRNRLVLYWQYPSPVFESSLSFSAAIAKLAGDDPRPLFIFREADDRKKKVRKAFEKTLKDEKILLSLRWFHCIKMDRRVAEKENVFYKIFDRRPMPDLIVCSRDGAKFIGFHGIIKARKLFSAMIKALRVEYRRSPVRALKAWFTLLNRFDSLDSREIQLRRALQKYTIKKQFNKIKPLLQKLRTIRLQREGHEDRETQINNLVLKRVPMQRSIDDFDSEAASEVKSGGRPTLLDKVNKGKEKKKRDGG